jgi:signal transduction histidine kinase/ligand-binding sensor domain-containing protein/CheY-like chemotaxis protein
MGHPRVVAIAGLILLFTAIIVSAQQNDIRFERISVDQGLSQSSVFCIFQDSRGLLWFGTEDGLNKYDGYKFTIYRHDHDNPASLSDNYINVIYEDRSGVLWIGTRNGGLNRFDREKEQFTHYMYEANNPSSLSRNNVQTICEDKSGMLWIGTDYGLNRFDRDEKKITRFVYETDESKVPNANYVLNIVKGSSGILWLGTWNGLARFDQETGQFFYYRHDPNDPSSLSNNNIVEIYKDLSGVLWVGTEGGGLNRFDQDNERFTKFLHNDNDLNSLGGSYIHAIYQDRSGVLWVGTWDGGLSKFDSDTEQFTRYQHDAYNPKSLSHTSILSIYEDRSGVLWIGTYEGGLNKFDRQKEQFAHYRHNPNDSQSLSNNDVWSIYEGRPGTVWIGTMGGGLNKFDRESEKFEHFRSDANDPRSLNHDYVWSIHGLSHGGEDVLWIGTYYGVGKYSLETGQFTRYVHDAGDPASLTDNIARAVYEDELGMVWVGTWNGGLNLLNRSTEQFTKVVHATEIVSLYEDDSDVLWVGTTVGLEKIDRGTLQVTHYRHDRDDAASLSHDIIWSIYESHHGGKNVLWFGTNDGLNRFDRDTERFTRYTMNDGLPNNVIVGILDDAQGNIWLSTNKGLSRFNPEKETFRNYDVSDGLQSNEFNVGAHCKSGTGELFFGGINGFNRFHPDSLTDNPHVPPIVITDFQIFNESVRISDDDQTRNEKIYTLPKHIVEVEEIELSYRESVFSFEFTALDYRNPQKNQYAYMMVGFDKDWYHTNADRRYATYTNLDPGKYIFRVKGSNNNGIWNDAGASIILTITSPPWRTGWAYGIYILLIGIIIFGVWRFRVSRLKLHHELEMEHFEADKLREMDEVKSHFFANISHEFRTPLTLIQGPLKQLLSDEFQGQPKKLYRMMLRNSHRLLQLINQLLDLSKLESGRMVLQTRPENIIKILKGLVLSFMSLAERKKITLTFDAKDESIRGYVDRDKIEKIITNLLSNAFKFTPERGKISVSAEETTLSQATESKRGVLIAISDTGQGITPDRLDKIFDRFYQVDDSMTRKREGTGIGLALAKELVELHYGEIQVSSEVGKGTIFTVRLPLEKQHLKPEEIVEEPSEKPGLPEIPISLTDVEATPQADIIPSSKKSVPVVLIVEDNADVRSYIRSYLDQDYRNIEASDGQEGLTKAISKMPDLIVSDIMMPRMDGVELCRRIKTDERTSHIPLILLTAKADVEAKIEGLETGADDYITKPFDAHELQARV